MWLDGAVPRVKINKGPEDWHHRDLALQSYKNWRSTDPRQRCEKNPKKMLQRKFFQHPLVLLKTQVTKKSGLAAGPRLPDVC